MITLNARSLVLALSVVLGVAIVGYGAYAYDQGLVPFGPRDDEWSGVFLTNGQAYFGHLYSAPGDYVILRDVHYVLATQLQTQDPAQQTGTQLSLQRLGNEIHGPLSEMRIAKGQILFIERLRTDSPLIQAIAQLRNAPAATPAPQQPQRTVGPTVTPAASPSPARSPSPSPR